MRRDLIPKKGIKKYFLYAIGEIFLVVVGILIALQINNWNEFKKERAREKMYLQSLEIDLKESQDELRRVIEKTDTISLATIKLIEISLDTVPMPAPAEFDELLMHTYGYTIAMTNEGTINDIIGSGDLKVISNDSLRRMIASWDAGFKMIRERENFLKQAFRDNKEMLNDKVDLAKRGNHENRITHQQDRLTIINDIEHRNSLVNMVISSQPLNELYRDKIKSLDTMIAITQKELLKLKES